MTDATAPVPQPAPSSPARPSAPPLATGPLGMALLSFHRVPLHTVFEDAAVRYVLVALWHRGRLLMVHERERNCWELPGGRIEPGEAPREAAVRELYEETGQRADADGGLRFLGYARTALGPEQRVRYGAFFTGRTARPRPFTPNAEIAAIHWREDGAPTLPGCPPAQVQSVDLYLAELCIAEPGGTR